MSWESAAETRVYGVGVSKGKRRWVKMEGKKEGLTFGGIS